VLEHQENIVSGTKLNGLALKAKGMAVVVRDKGPIAVILLAITILSLVSLAIVIFLAMEGRGNVIVVAIPGFPPESLLIGLLSGVFLVLVRRRYNVRKARAYYAAVSRRA